MRTALHCRYISLISRWTVGFMQKCNIWCLLKSPQSNCQLEAPLKSGLLQRLQHFHKVCCRGNKEVEAETSCSYGCAAAA